MSVSFLAENRTMRTIRARVAFHSRQHGFDKCMQQVLNSEQNTTGSQIAELYAFWGDPLTPSDEQFLRSCLAEAGAAKGPVMLCGASLLTLVLGALCAQDESKSKQLWCLEHDRHWGNLIRSWLTEYQIGAAHVIQSPAKLFEDYVWYGVDIARLAKNYQLVICDGAQTTPQGVIGAINRMAGCLDDNFTVLARNVKDPAMLRNLNAWAGEHDARFVLIDKQGGFVKLTRKNSNTATVVTQPALRKPSARQRATDQGQPVSQQQAEV